MCSGTRPGEPTCSPDAISSGEMIFAMAIFGVPKVSPEGILPTKTPSRRRTPDPSSSRIPSVALDSRSIRLLATGAPVA
jgi:hypothetical protein